MLGVANLLCYAVGLLYPTYKSFKALLCQGIQDDTTVNPAPSLDYVLKLFQEKPELERKLSSPEISAVQLQLLEQGLANPLCSTPADPSFLLLCCKWLAYWVVYAFMGFGEACVNSLYIWIPFYYEAKLIFLLWLILPQTKGAKIVFESYIVPFMQRYASQLDPVFNTADSVLQSQQVGQAVSLAATYGPSIAQQAMQKAYEEAAKLAQQSQRAGPQAAVATGGVTRSLVEQPSSSQSRLRVEPSSTAETEHTYSQIPLKDRRA